MGAIYENLIRPVLFRLDPEKAHDFGVTFLDYLGRLGGLCNIMEAFNQPARTVPVELFGVSFPNRVGLAAGMDKNGRFWRAASALGFGHVEIGTVTAQKQPGNDRPRVFRFPEEAALINRMGFNNDGSEEIAARLKALKINKRKRIPIGINIGKSRVTPLDEAVEDYLKSFHRLAPFADYISLNVSSPNTPDLRKLQSRERLDELLGSLASANESRSRKLGSKPVPILLKIAPDLSFREIDSILELIEAHMLSGIIATNTTLSRPPELANQKQSGGLSGKPLHQKSLKIVKYISLSTNGRLPVIGIGGIDSAETAGAMVDAGAHLIQIYTGMIYRGPFLAAQLAKALSPRQRHWV